MEKRQFSRVPFHITAVIKYQENIYEGEVSDLSLKGVFLKTSALIEVGDQFELTIHLAGEEDEEESVHVFAKVARKTAEGLGVLFERTDLDSFVHLRNIVGYNSSDPDKIIEEFTKVIKKPN